VSAGVLVAGIGNVFFGDDGFGVEVARRLAAGSLPPGVEVEDFGIRALHLAYRLLEPPGLLVLVDALRRGGAPGTLYVIYPELEDAPGEPIADGHTVDVASVLAGVRALGGVLPAVRVVGCEPEVLDAGIGLGAAVERAVPEAVRLVRELVEQHVAAIPRATEREEATPWPCGVGGGTGRDT
jgi:hydrogenase maturation protease